MSLREKVENNLAIWLFGALGTGFLAGLGAYKSVIGIAQLDVIPKSRLEELEARCRPEVVASKLIEPAPEPSGGNPKLQNLPIQAGNQKEKDVSSGESLEHFLRKPERPPEAEDLKPLEMRFSENLLPFPEHFDLIRPGMGLSEARAAFPRGEVSSGHYSVDIESGPFEHVVFYAFSRGEDPSIDSIQFFYRSANSQQLVVSETMRKFGGIKHNSESLGAVLSWPDVNGFKLELGDNSYQISRRDEKLNWMAPNPSGRADGNRKKRVPTDHLLRR